VLYEHTKPAEFIPFGKPPSEIMFDTTTLKYAQILSAGYGLSLSDIGMSTSANGGETLAGSIRQERKTRKGMSRLKKKVTYFLDFILPDTLRFNIIDPDEEFSVALGRARLANATAWGLMVDKGLFSPQEARMQTMADGLTTIDLPEEPPKEAKDMAKKLLKPAQSPQRPGMLGKPVPPSQGGQGEIKKSLTDAFEVQRVEHFDSHLKRFTGELVRAFTPVLIGASEGLSEDQIFMLRSYIDDSMFGENDDLGIASLIQTAWMDKTWLNVAGQDEKMIAYDLEGYVEDWMLEELSKYYAGQYEDGEIDTPEVSSEIMSSLLVRIHGVNYLDYAARLNDAIRENIKSFIGKSVLYLTKSLVLSEDVFDAGGTDSYDNVVNSVYKALYDNFDEYVRGCVDVEIENILNTIRLEIGNGKSN
jgi:hypothetical protein